MEARLALGRAATAFALLVGMASPAAALDAQLFAPAVDPLGYFTAYSSQTGGAGRFHLGVWYNAGEDPISQEVLVVTNPGFPPLIAPTLEPIEVKTVSLVQTLDVTGSFT
ncbi:MAG: hypothetical protein ACREQJ_06330, partial [Candidatus Binatia bacterium]